MNTNNFAQKQISKLNLMPVPAQVILKDGIFRLSDSFSVAVRGTAHERLYKGANRTLARLAGRTGLMFQKSFLTPGSQIDSAQMFIICNREGQIRLKEDESYELIISPDRIELRCETDIGGLNGLETFLQLVKADGKGYYLHALHIKDRPRFPWRGLLIDVCRHFMPVHVLKHNLDAMAAVKLNVFHWHLTEDQGFRIESKKFPKLHQMGSDGLYYTQEQIKEIIEYASDRGIRVVPEFDMPGHATSWFVGHPEIASAPGPFEIERGYGIKDPTMDPTREEVYDFLDAFWSEMAAVFPDEYFHIGGDENNGNMWNANQNIQAYMKAHNISDNNALQAYFNNRILKILTRYGKKMIGWDEILHPDMPTSIVIQSWRGTEALVESARRGYMGILSNGYYIDLCRPAEFHYLNDPVPGNADLKPEESARILGGEATMWAEIISSETIDSRIWPRTAAIAERFWSPRAVRDVEDMYNRLGIIERQLEEHGLNHLKNYDLMLRRLANSDDIAALKIFVDILEPVEGYRRHDLGVTYTFFTPLTRVVDAARPESMTARKFAKAVDTYLKDTRKRKSDDIVSWLETWRDNDAALRTTIVKSPILKETALHARSLMGLAGAGLRAIRHIQSGKPAPKAWFEAQLKIIEKAKKPAAETELAVVSPIEKLVHAAGEKK